MAEYFKKFISFCEKDNFIRFNFSGPASKVKDPVKVLFTTATLDGEFFNALVASFLQDKEGWALNKGLNNARFRRRFFICLQAFVEKHQAAAWLTGETLENIADSLIAYAESGIVPRAGEELDALPMAAFFYQVVMSQEDRESECYLRVMHKLRQINNSKQDDCIAISYQ